MAAGLAGHQDPSTHVCVAFQVTQIERQSRVSKSRWLTEVEQDGEINHCHPWRVQKGTSKTSTGLPAEEEEETWGGVDSWQVLCVTAEKPGQDTRIWASGWTTHVQHALALVSGGGGMRVWLKSALF